MIFLFLVFFCLVFGLFFIRSVYLSPISIVRVVPSSCCTLDFLVISVKPTKKFFKSISCGYDFSFVSLGNGYLAFFVGVPDQLSLSFNDIQFSSDVYIFKRSAFGRYKSVDLSDRCLNDILNKFKGV